MVVFVSRGYIDPRDTQLEAYTSRITKDLEYSDASFGVVNNPEIMRAILCSEDCVYRERVVSCFGDNVVGLCAESS